MQVLIDCKSLKLPNISEYWNGTVILEDFKHVFEISRENAGWIFDRLDTSHRCCVGWSVKYETIVHETPPLYNIEYFGYYFGTQSFRYSYY